MALSTGVRAAGGFSTAAESARERQHESILRGPKGQLNWQHGAHIIIMAEPFASPQQLAEKLRYLLSDKERELADLRARTKVLRSQARRMEGNVQGGRQQLQQGMEDAEKASKELSDLQIHEVLAGASRARLTASKTRRRERRPPIGSAEADSPRLSTRRAWRGVAEKDKALNDQFVANILRPEQLRTIIAKIIDRHLAELAAAEARAPPQHT